MRSTSRGAAFRANINLGDRQNPASTAVTLIADTAALVYPQFPPYSVANYTPAGASALARQLSVAFWSNDWHGRYRVFVRYEMAGGASGDVAAQLTLQTGSVTGIIRTSAILDSETGTEKLWDFGEFTLPGMQPLEYTGYCHFVLEMSNTNAGGADVYLFDLILIPTDEYAFDISDSDVINADSSHLWPRRIEADSIIDPKQIMRTIGVDTANLIQRNWLSITGDRLQFNPGATQRIWFLGSTRTTDEEARAIMVNSIQMESVTRYLGLRTA